MQVTIPNSKKSFFTDRTDKRFRGNKKTAFTTPRTYSTINDNAFNDFMDFSRSISSQRGLEEDWFSVQDELKTKFGIEIPHFNDYIPEVDDKYWISPTDPTGIGFALNGKSFKSKAPQKEKISYLNNLIQTELSKLPEADRDMFKGYDHYFNLRKDKAKQSMIEMGLDKQYADSAWDYFAGSAAGTIQGAFHDPIVLATLPLSMMYGWQGGIVYASLRAAAIEAVIGAGSETLIQTQVVPYRQSLGQDYTWKDASKTIGVVALGAGVLGGTFTGAAKSTVALYKHAELALAKVNPNIRNKLIGKEFKKFFGIEKVKRTYKDKNGKTKTYYVEQASRNVDPELMFEYLQKQIAKLQPSELLMLYKSLPESIRLHPRYQEAAKDLETKILDDADNPLDNTTSGRVEHNERVNKSVETILRNEDTTVSERPTTTIIYNDSKKPLLNHQRLNPDDLDADPETFQFKTGGDSKGVMEKLQGITKWDDVASGTVMVWQRSDGKMFIADGHQRLGLAKRLKAKGQKVELNAQVRREADGWTAADVMIDAMMVNVVAGTARADDLARIMLKLGENALAVRVAGKIKPSQAIYQTAVGLTKLGDEGFNYWLRSDLKDLIAAQVGDIVDDPTASINIMKILEAAKPKDTIEARMMIRQALGAGMVTTEQVSLFGKSIMKESLFVERTKVYTAALRDLKKEKSVFRALVENDDAIVKSGRNKLDTQYNVDKAQQNAIAISKIEKLANRKGELSDELTAAARQWKDGNKRQAVETFKRAIKRSIERGDHKGIDAIGSERTTYVTKSEAPSRKKPSQKAVEKNLETHSNPQKSKDYIDQKNSQIDEVIDETKSGAASGAAKTSDTVKEPSGTKTQDDFFQATTAEPPASVLAKASGTPSELRTLEVNSIGDLITIGDINFRILQTSGINKLYKLANKNISNIESSINNIAINFKNAKTKVNIKDKTKLKNKIKKRQAIYGKEYNERFIGDIARGRIILEDVNEVVNGLNIEGFLRKNFKIISRDDYFANPKTDTGYRAIHFQLVTKDGLAFELQVHNAKLVKLYDNLRKLPNSSYTKYKDLGRSLTPEEDADRLQLAAKEKVEIDKLAAQVELEAKALPRQEDPGGLFDEMRRNQLDLTDEVAVGVKEIDGQQVVETRTMKQIIDDIEEDTKIVDFLKDCPGIK
jgi:ppGpp synthetase/RelA/SpoT-type nucleotidyltranferase